MKKKYFYRVYDENNNLIFSHTSDYAYRLLKMADKESHDSSGATYCSWYFGRVETNIDDRTEYLVSCGHKI